MTNQEIERLLEKKKNELATLEQDLMNSKYSKHVSALTTPILNSNTVIGVIHQMNLNADDCRYLGEQIAAKFNALYQNFAPAISARQERRKHKSDARRARRSMRNRVVELVEQASAEAGDNLPEERVY